MELMKRKVKACSVLGITMSSLFIFAGIVTALNYSEYNGDFYTDISKCMHRGLGLLIMCVGISFLVYFILENVKNDIVEEKETVEHLENNIVN